MADSINSVDCIAVLGTINRVTPKLHDIRKPDASGLAAKFRGSNAGATTIRIIRDVADWAAAETALGTYATWIGDVVAVVQGGQTRNVFIWGFKEQERRMLAKQVGGTGASNLCYTEVEFDVERVS